MAQEDTLNLRFELVSPKGMVFEGDVDMVVLPAVTGEMGIMPRHAPLVAQLSIGRLRALTMDGQWLSFAVSEGFAKVQFNKVIVLAGHLHFGRLLAHQQALGRGHFQFERVRHGQAFFMQGTIEEVVEKAQELAKA